MRIQTSLMVGAFVVFAATSVSAQSLRIDPFPLQGAGGAVVSKTPAVSGRIGEQVRRGDVATGQLTESSLQARQQLSEQRSAHSLPEPVANIPVSPEAVQAFQPVRLARPAVVASVSPRADVSGLVRIPVPDWARLKTRSAQPDDSLEAVLRQWSAQEGVELIWRSPRSFPVLAPVNGGGSYEVSVRALLDQYQNSSQRPVASLHVDTQTGARTLLVNLQGNV